MSLTRHGSKVTDSHTTATEAVQEVVDVLNRADEVSKMSLGLIKNIGGSHRRVKFLPSVGGIRIVVRGSGATQDLFVYTSKPEVTQKAVEEKFQ